MIKPYYEEPGITIYCADCRDVLPQLEPVDLVLTDPPYPEMKGGLKVTFTSGVSKRYVTNKTVGIPWGNDLDGLKMAAEKARLGLLSFCSFHSVCFVPAVVGLEAISLITWFQRNSMPSINNSPHFQCEYVWAFKTNPGLEWRKLKTHYDVLRLQTGCFASERICTKGEADHPTQKPISLIRSLLKIGGETILDPYMGSGTTLRAAKDLGRKAIGIEIEQKYCDIAIERLRQGVLL